MVCINSLLTDMGDPSDLPVIPTLTTSGHSALFLREREAEIGKLAGEFFPIIGSIPGLDTGVLTAGQGQHYARYFATLVRAAREQGTRTDRMHTGQGEHPMTRSLVQELASEGQNLPKQAESVEEPVGHFHGEQFNKLYPEQPESIRAQVRQRPTTI